MSSALGSVPSSAPTVARASTRQWASSTLAWRTVSGATCSTSSASCSAKRSSTRSLAPTSSSTLAVPNRPDPYAASTCGHAGSCRPTPTRALARPWDSSVRPANHDSTDRARSSVCSDRDRTEADTRARHASTCPTATARPSTASSTSPSVRSATSAEAQAEAAADSATNGSRPAPVVLAPPSMSLKSSEHTFALQPLSRFLSAPRPRARPGVGSDVAGAGCGGGPIRRPGPGGTSGTRRRYGGSSGDPCFGCGQPQGMVAAA